MAIEVRQAGQRVETLVCECGAFVELERTDPKRAPWIYQHLGHGAVEETSECPPTSTF